MIVNHPDPTTRMEQESLLSALPQEKREKQDLIFSYANAVYRFHKQGNQLVIPCMEDYLAWLEQLSDTLREEVEKMGFNMAQRQPMLIQFAKERNVKDQETYIKDLMGKANFERYLEVTESKLNIRKA